MSSHAASVDTFDVPEGAGAPLGRVTQYVAAMQGLGPLHDELHALWSATRASRPDPPSPGPATCAAARARSPVPAIVTTAFDGGIERAFADAGEELDVVTYVAAGRAEGSSSTRPGRRAPASTFRTRTPIFRWTSAPSCSAPRDRRPRPDRTWESLVVTEDDHIDYPGASELEAAIPVTLAARLRRSHLLFLGYDLDGLEPPARRHSALGAGVRALRVVGGAALRRRPLEMAFWRHLDVGAVEVDENAFAGLLDGRLDGMAAA